MELLSDETAFIDENWTITVVCLMSDWQALVVVLFLRKIQRFFRKMNR